LQLPVLAAKSPFLLGPYLPLDLTSDAHAEWYPNASHSLGKETRIDRWNKCVRIDSIVCTARATPLFNHHLYLKSDHKGPLNNTL